MSYEEKFPKLDSHNRARHWIAERTGAYVTQAELKTQASEVGVEHLFTAAKGIYKPAGSEYVFSIRHEPTGKYVDRDPETSGNVWSIIYDAETHNNSGTYAPSSTAAFKRCIRDRMPIAVLWRHEEGQPYENLGLGLPLDFSAGAFLIAGPYEHLIEDNEFVGRLHETVLADLSHTDAPTAGLRRLEQHLLRTGLLKGEATGICRLCGIELPAHLLVASHIKPRNLCNRQERLNKHIATLMCLLGCDALYERGYLRVKDDGAVYRFNESGGNSLRSYLQRYDGKKIIFRDLDELEFFRFHRGLVFSA